ncbi:MAG: CPBP family intramembrane glutamic endopeptidase [Pyrinomonadaceae bacterium]
MRFKTRLFVILLLAGLAGVFSFLLVDLSALVANFTLPAGTKIPTFTPVLKLLSLIQPAIILSVAVLVGVGLASKVGLSSPVAEAAASGGQMSSALKPQIVPGLIGGLAGGIAVVLSALLSKPFLPPEVVPRIAELGRLLPLPTRLLYGGITEELLLRWGLMTLLVWAAWRLLQKGNNKPKPTYFVVAILISSLIFGIGHLPIAFLLVREATAALIFHVIAANSVFGLIAGYLYWKRGLESAMIAHMLAHVVMLTASYLGAYF